MTPRLGATSAAECECDVGYYDAAGSDDARACTACDAAMVCEASGVTLGNVALVPHAWRLSNATSAVMLHTQIFGWLLLSRIHYGKLQNGHSGSNRSCQRSSVYLTDSLSTAMCE